MNAKLILKTLFVLVVLSLLVLMGLNNKQTASFALPPLLPKPFSQPAAIMYFAFFAVGWLTGVIMTAGSKRGSGSSSKPGKSDK
ncbi:MAG: hypothetical protein ACYDH9_23005 [Limisphaerales bacterium]